MIHAVHYFMPSRRRVPSWDLEAVVIVPPSPATPPLHRPPTLSGRGLDLSCRWPDSLTPPWPPPPSTAWQLCKRLGKSRSMSSTVAADLVTRRPSPTPSASSTTPPPALSSTDPVDWWPFPRRRHPPPPVVSATSAGGAASACFFHAIAAAILTGLRPPMRSHLSSPSRSPPSSGARAALDLHRWLAPSSVPRGGCPSSLAAPRPRRQSHCPLCLEHAFAPPDPVTDGRPPWSGSPPEPGACARRRPARRPSSASQGGSGSAPLLPRASTGGYHLNIVSSAAPTPSTWRARLHPCPTIRSPASTPTVWSSPYPRSISLGGGGCIDCSSALWQ